MKRSTKSPVRSKVCAFKKCQRGVDRKRAHFFPIREHQKYCSDACRYNDFIERKKAGVVEDREIVSRIQKIEKKLGI